MSMSAFIASVETYARGKSWRWYAPLWLLGLYAFYELFQFDMLRNQMPLIWLVPYSFNFFIHEWAHIFTAFLPPVLTASAGSGSELLLGLALIVLAFWQRSYFASLFCFLWLDLACQSAGQYMADAVPMRLPLFSLGAALSGSSEAKHDWNFVFGQLHLLGASVFIGNTLRFIGVLCGLFGVLFSAWVLYKMSQAPRWAETSNEAVLAISHEPMGRPTAKTLEDEGFTSYPVIVDTEKRPQSDPTDKHI